MFLIWDSTPGTPYTWLYTPVSTRLVLQSASQTWNSRVNHSGVWNLCYRYEATSWTIQKVWTLCYRCKTTNWATQVSKSAPHTWSADDLDAVVGGELANVALLRHLAVLGEGRECRVVGVLTVDVATVGRGANVAADAGCPCGGRERDDVVRSRWERRAAVAIGGGGSR